ncbi:MAG: glycosyltransferase family 2 protein [Planctomycetaceae bacterium]|nr:glycosyltransferase family 2 protein [Planctomycetaceae bacterium]
MNFRPLVSVVVPTFNRARHIAEAIESALAQSWDQLEVLVVDDGSTDDTADIVADLIRRDDRVRYFAQPNGGVSAARNRALGEAQGAFIAFLDSDDAWLPWKLEVQMELFWRFPQAAMCWTDMEAVDANGVQQFPRYLRLMYSNYERFPAEQLFPRYWRLGELLTDAPADLSQVRVGTGNIYRRMLFGNLVHTSTVVLRRAIAQRVGLFDESMRRGGEDFRYHLRTCRYGDAMLLDIPSIRYRVGEDDRITHPRNNLYFARNYLRTLKEELASPPPERDLAPTYLERRAILAEAHQWLGDAEVNDGYSIRSAWHCLRSLWLGAPPRHAIKTLIKSGLPQPATEWLRAKKRAQHTASLRDVRSPIGGVK